MAHVIIPTLVSLSDDFRLPISVRNEPQLKDCVIFADPTEAIKKHPSVFDFYNGTTDRLAIDDLSEFCRELWGHTCRYGDDSRQFVVGTIVMDNIPREQTPNTFQTIFSKITGKDLTQYFTAQDRPVVDDFLDRVMCIDKSKITKAIPVKPTQANL